jgi:Domain of unknown function (DUF4349)
MYNIFTKKNQMKTSRKVFFAIILLMAFNACDKSIDNYEESASMEFVETEQDNVGLLFANSDAGFKSDLNEKVKEIPSRTTEALIIRTADMGLRLVNYQKDKNTIYDAVKAQNGYISRENERNETYRVSNDLQIRVPTDNFDELVAALTTGDGIQNIDYKRINALDVGEEYTDIQARLKTKKEVEQQYISILKQAKTIKDILAVNEQIRRIREEIEANEGRMRYLSDRISFSTINLSVYQNLEGGSIIEKPGFFNKLKNAMQGGWNGLMQIILVAAYLWPLWIILIGLIYLLRKRPWRRLRGNREKQE